MVLQRWLLMLAVLFSLAACGGTVPSTPVGGAAVVNNAATLAVSTLSTPVFSNVVQNSRISATVQVSSNVADQYGAALAGVTVTFKATGITAASNSTATAVSGANGIATASITYDPNNAPTVVASAVGITSGVSAFAPHPVAIIKLASAITTGITADGTGTYSVTAQVKDAYGSPVQNEAISFSNTGSGFIVLTPSSLVTGAGGTVILTVTDIYTANDTVNISALAGGISTATPLTLSFVGTGTGGAGGGANAGNAIALVASANNLPADKVTAATITATVTDAAGAAVPNLSLTISKTGAAILSLANATTNAQGVATFTVKDSIGEAVSVSVSDGTSTSVLNQTFIPAVAALTVVSNTTTVLADGTATATLTIAAKDAQGRGVTGEQLAIVTNSATASIPNTAVTDVSAGQATVNIFNMVAETVKVTVKARNGGSLPGVVKTGSVTVTFEKAIGSLALVSNATSVIADNKTQATLRATVRDVKGVPLNGRTVSFTATGRGTLALTALGVTDIYGVATATLKDSYAENVNLVASINGINKTQSIVFTPVVKTLNVTISPSNVAADGVSVATVLVNVKDINGIPIVGQKLSFADSYGSFAQFSIGTATTGASGTAQMTVKDLYAELVTLKVTAGATNKTANINFKQTKILLAASVKTPFVANINNNAVTVTVTDQLGKPVANQVFTVSTTGSMTSSATTITTDVNGNAKVPLTVSNTVAETATLNFTDVLGVTFGVPIQFVASTASALSLTVTPSSVVPDGVAIATVSAVVRDVYGVAVSSAFVDFYTNTSSSAVLSQGSGITDAAGRISVNVSDTYAETTTINARLTKNKSVATSTTVVFEKAVALINLVSDVTSVSADNTAIATLTATILDANGAPLKNRTVSFTTTGNATLTTAAVTNASGVTTVTLKDATAETVNVVANINGFTKPQSITFTAVPSSVQIAQIPVLGNVVADGVQLHTLKVKVLDKGNKVIVGQLIDIYATSSKGGFVSVSPTQATADPITGILSVTVTDLYASSDTVTVWASAGTGVGKKSASSSLAFVGSAPNQPAAISIQANKARVLTDGIDSTILAAIVQDVNGAAVANVQVSFSTNAGLLSSSQVVTDKFGKAAATLSSGASRQNAIADVYASVVGLSTTALIPIQMVGTTVTLTSTRTTLDVYGTSWDTLVATVTDAANAPVYNVPVHFSAQVSGALKFVDLYSNTVDLYTDVSGRVQVDVYGGVATLANVTPSNTTANVTAGGASASQAYTVTGGAAFAITAPLLTAGTSLYSMVNTDAVGALIPLQLDISYATPNAAIVFATSLGTLSNVATGVPTVTGSSIQITSDANGAATAYLTSNAAGIATLQVYEKATPATSDTMKIAISLPATSAQIVTLQASNNNVRPSSGGGTPNTVTLTATVWDNIGTGRQVVANVPVQFVLSGTTGGGEFITPSLGITNTSGVATATFASGSLSSSAKGVGVVANIAGATVATSNVTMTFNPSVGGASPTITRTVGSFITDGFNTTTIGLPFIIQVRNSVKNDGAYRVTAVTALKLTLDLVESLVAETVAAKVTQAGDLSRIVIGGTAGSVAIGLGTQIQLSGSTSYIQPLSVLVSDAAGAAIPNAKVSLKVEPIRYSVGEWYDFDATIASKCQALITGTYGNEDLNKNFILDPGEDIQAQAGLLWSSAGIDIYGNLLAGTTAVNVGPDLQLTPRQSDAGSLPTSVTTDVNGVGNFNLTYLKQYAPWLEVRVTATVLVAGTETSSFRDFRLPFEATEGSSCVLFDSPYNVGVTPRPPFLSRNLIGQ